MDGGSIVSDWGAMLLRTWTCSAVRVDWDSWAIGCERRRGRRQKDGYLNRSASYQRGEKDHTKSIPPPLVLERMEKVYAGHFGIRINQTLSSSTILYRNRSPFFWVISSRQSIASCKPCPRNITAEASNYLACDFHASNHGRERGWRHCASRDQETRRNQSTVIG